MCIWPLSCWTLLPLSVSNKPLKCWQKMNLNDVFCFSRFLSTYLMPMLTISSVEPNSVDPDWAATTWALWSGSTLSDQRLLEHLDRDHRGGPHLVWLVFWGCARLEAEWKTEWTLVGQEAGWSGSMMFLVEIYPLAGTPGPACSAHGWHNHFILDSPCMYTIGNVANKTGNSMFLLL